MSADIEKKSLLDNPAAAEELFQLEKLAREGMVSSQDDASRIAAHAFVKVLPANEAVLRGGIDIIRDINRGRAASEAGLDVVVGTDLTGGSADAPGEDSVTPGECLFQQHPHTEPEKAFSSDPVSAVREMGKFDFEHPRSNASTSDRPVLVTDAGKACLSEMADMIETAKTRGQLIGPQRPVETPARTAAALAKASVSG